MLDMLARAWEAQNKFVLPFVPGCEQAKVVWVKWKKMDLPKNRQWEWWGCCVDLLCDPLNTTRTPIPGLGKVLRTLSGFWDSSCKERYMRCWDDDSGLHKNPGMGSCS